MMQPATKDDNRNKNLKGKQRIRVSRSKTSGSNQKSIPSPVPNEVIEVSQAVGTEKKHQTINSTALEHARIIKRACSSYVTLLDIGRMNEVALPASRIAPTEKLVPNPYHQRFHVARWRKWLRQTPQWILNMGSQNLWKIAGQNGHQRNEAHSSAVVWKNKSDEDVEVMDMNESSKQQDIEMKEEGLTEWRDWSIQLTDSNNLLITGKTNQNTIEMSRDVSHCKRIDANTLHHNDGSVYILSGMPDHFTNLPYYVRNKFQYGFPDDWKAVKYKWMQYVKAGSPSYFNWTTETDACVSDAAVVEDSTGADILCQVITSGINLLSVSMSETLLHQIPVNREKFEQSNSVAVQNDVSQLNSKDKQDCLKDSQSLVKQDSYKVRCDALLNSTKVIATMDPDESSHDSSGGWPDLASYVRHSSDTAKKVSNPNDTGTTNSATEVIITANREIILKRWTPVRVNCSDLKITGYIKSELDTKVAHTTDIVVKRKTYNSIQCKDGTVYKLMGTFVDPKNRVPDLIKEKLAKGLPVHWRSMMKTWASYAVSSEAEIV